MRLLAEKARRESLSLRNPLDLYCDRIDRLFDPCKSRFCKGRRCLRVGLSMRDRRPRDRIYRIRGGSEECDCNHYFCRIIHWFDSERVQDPYDQHQAIVTTDSD
jgi:hypothetical protein